MGGEEGGEHSVLPNGISAVCLTAKVKTPCDRRLREMERKEERERERSLNHSSETSSCTF